MIRQKKAGDLSKGFASVGQKQTDAPASADYDAFFTLDNNDSFVAGYESINQGEVYKGPAM